MTARTFGKRATALLGIFLSFVMSPDLARAQNPPPDPKRAQTAAIVQTLQEDSRGASRQLALHNYREASRRYEQVINRAYSEFAFGQQLGNKPSATPDVERVLGDAHFGRASAMQQGMRPASSDSTAIAEWRRRTLGDYSQAIDLDSARLAPSSYNNMGVLLRDAGDSRGALYAFLKAASIASSDQPARGAFFMHAGGMYAQLGIRDSASLAYRHALSADSSLGAARAALMELMLGYDGADSVLALARRWVTDSRASAVVEDALYQVLGEKRPGAGMPDSAYELLLRSFLARGLSAASMLEDEGPRLRALANAGLLKAPIDSMLALASSRTRDQVFAIDPRDTRWWTPLPRASMWGGMLRVFGDAHNAAGRTELARAFYESALGFPWNGMPPEYMDIESIVPLANLYSQLPDSTARIDALINGAFNEKSIAYAQQDLPRIRRFHMALGTFFAARDDWRSGPRGALFQLERMRNATAQINQRNPNAEPLRDPPELLDQLWRGYCFAGRTADAVSLMPEIIEGYKRIGAATPSPIRPCPPPRTR